MPYTIYAAGDSNLRPRTPVSLTDELLCCWRVGCDTHSSSFWSTPAAPAQVPAFSSRFQNSLLLAYVQGFLEPSGLESCADASGTFRNIFRASGHVRTPFLDLEHPIRNPGSVHPQARLGLTFASDTPTLVLLAVHRLTHIWRPLETSHVAPERVRTCHP